MTRTNQTNSFLGSEQTPSYTPTSDERMLAILCHILTPFFWILPPLIIYIMKKDESQFVAEHARESLNFWLTVSLIAIILSLSFFGIVLIWPLGLVVLIFVIIATVKASENKLYQYPFTIRLIK
jgi:uncharacterized Tic20 family protein